MWLMFHKEIFDVTNINRFYSMCFRFIAFYRGPVAFSEPLQITWFCDWHVFSFVLQVLLVVESCMEMVRVTLSSHTLLALAMN